MEKGKFIVIEGIDGSGKSTLCKKISEKLQEKGIPVFLTFEPSTSIYGKKLRESFTKKERPGIKKELELFTLDRREHINNEVNPALEKGIAVVCDRYYFSTMAYQGAMGADPKEIRKENESLFPMPDLVIILVIKPEDAILRITKSRGEAPNNFEKLDYLKKVSGLFDAINPPPPILRLDSNMSPEMLTEKALEYIDKIL